MDHITIRALGIQMVGLKVFMLVQWKEEGNPIAFLS